MKYIIVFILFFQLAGISILSAQTNQQVWGEYMLNYPFANSWNVELAGTYSTVLGDPKWRALDLQVTPEYAISNRIDVMGGLLISRTFQDESLTTFEVREMLGARFHFTPNRRILTRLLVRIENRNIQNRDTDEWESSNRFRFRTEVLIPLNKPTMYSGDKVWYSILDAEAFVVMDQDADERFANRLRIRAGVGYRINYGLRLEFVYTLQRSRNAIDDDSPTTSNIFRFRVKQYLNKSKPSTVTGTGN